MRNALHHIMMLPALLFAFSTCYAEIPRAPNGKPDLQGVWANNSATPLERPAVFDNRATLTDEEVAEYTAKHDELFTGEGEAAFGDSVFNSIINNDEEHESYDPDTGNYNHFWVVDREIENRTSLIVDPPNGQLPPLTEDATARDEAHAAYVAAHPSDSYTDRINSDRCITYGMPFIAAGYNGYFQIAQSDNHVAIMQEMAHETRAIPVSNGQHLPAKVRLWNGDSVGRWEGDTFVVETENYSSKSTFMQRTALSLSLTEKFTLIDEETLQWALTVSDPTTWVQPWTMVINLKKSADAIYEYACHEGNMSMEGILAGARAEEAEANAAGGNE